MESITDISQFEKYRGKIVFVEMGWNSYLTGFYEINDREPHFQDDGSFGYGANIEVSESGVHGCHALTTRDIERGSVLIREATSDETANVKISYAGIFDGLVAS